MFKALTVITLVMAPMALARADERVQLASCIAPTAQEKATCRPDVIRICPNALSSGIFAILACIRANRSKFGPACSALLSQCGQ